MGIEVLLLGAFVEDPFLIACRWTCTIAAVKGQAAPNSRPSASWAGRFVSAGRASRMAWWVNEKHSHLLSKINCITDRWLLWQVNLRHQPKPVSAAEVC